jgi:KaiC/GvpD/RAD55 family RecA-like ATPase
MISIEQILTFAIHDRTVMDTLGEALRSDLVLANPHQRRLAEFADEFLAKHDALPGRGDWDIFLESLSAGVIQDGTREALGRLWATAVPQADPSYFSQEVLETLRQTAATVARMRLNEMPVVTPEALASMAERVTGIKGGAVEGLAHLSSVDAWLHAPREDEWLPTGYPALDRAIGGWGKELWILFADAKAGKSMLLQNFATHAARRGACVLHVTLELGLRSQIHRYYRQLAESPRAAFAKEPDAVRHRLQHWFRLAKGDVYLLEYAAYELDVPTLQRTIARVGRLVGRPVSVLVLDYLDLLSSRSGSDGRNLADDLGRLTHSVRALCPALDLTVLTASQAVRRPEKAGRLTVRDMGDSYGKVRGADGLLSLNQTPEEAEMFQGRMGLLLARDAPAQGMEIPLYINRDMALIAPLDHPSTQKLMQKLGHLPHQLAPGYVPEPAVPVTPVPVAY